jgi:hypothetical protein
MAAAPSAAAILASCRRLAAPYDLDDQLTLDHLARDDGVV